MLTTFQYSELYPVHQSCLTHCWLRVIITPVYDNNKDQGGQGKPPFSVNMDNPGHSAGGGGLSPGGADGPTVGNAALDVPSPDPGV